MNPSQQEVQDALQALYNELNDAYFATPAIANKDRIRGCAEVVFGILSQLTVDGIKSRSADFQRLKASVQTGTGKLQQLQCEIDGVIRQIDIANNVTNGITKALDLTGKFLA